MQRIRMVDHFKAVLKSEVTDHHLDPDKPKSLISMYSSNSSQDEDELDGSVNTMGLRSPVGGALRGRSVKEIEEQLSNLKKENFNLKLRIYFLEEKMGTNFTLDKDNIVKKNIELQIEIANLQKEVQDKHQLLCQAVKAMELEEEEHKKYVSSKEEHLNSCQQELEDLRLQLQEIKFESDGMSLKSDTTGFFSSRITNSALNMTDLQEKIKILETELHMEKENNASLQFAISQADTWKTRYENMQKEFQAKDEIIKNLHDEIETANRQISSFTTQMKDVQDRFETTYRENQTLQKTIQSDNKRIDDIANQLLDLRKKYAMTKGDLEREQKKSEKIKVMNDMKVTELEEENQKQKLKVRDLQNKLESAMLEIRKNQNLAVPKSPRKTSNVSNTDSNSVSVQNSTTPTGVAEKDALHVSIGKDNQTEKSQNSLASQSPSMSIPEKFTVEVVDDEIHSLKMETQMQYEKIIKLKSEQMKACEIIKNMIEWRNKANDEINQLKEHIKQLEHELESVVSKPTSDGDSPVTLKQKITDLNIKAAVSKPDDEKSSSPSTSMAESSSQQPPEAQAMEDVEIVERYKTLTVELEAKAEILVAILNEKDYQMQKLRQQYEEILTTLEERENRIVDLEFELMTASEDGKDVDHSLLEKSDRDSEKHSSFYRHEIEEKDKEIEKLTVELKKCTCYLQEIVNKELWAKNREIEKLHNKQASSPEIVRLKKDLVDKEHQLNLLKQKISELGLDINISEDCSSSVTQELSTPVSISHISKLQEQLDNCKAERNYFKEKLRGYESSDYTEIIKDLRTKNKCLEEELEKNEHLRQKSNEVCSQLNTRLEELAVFLDSLLKQKSVLGFLGIHKERKLREMVNSSLDISKSFAMSMIINPDQSLAQLSNITSLLNGSTFQDLSLDRLQEEEDDEQAVLSIIPSSITLTYQSHLQKVDRNTQPNTDQVINALREQVFNLKSELKLRDVELNKLNGMKETTDIATETDSLNINNEIVKEVSNLFIPSINTECQSESEAWSEPDLNVSRERIGLIKTLPIGNLDVESTENDSLTTTTPTRKTSEKRASFTELHHQISQLQEAVQVKTKTLKTAEENLLRLKVIEKEFKETQLKLSHTEKRLEESEEDSKVLKGVIEELEKSKKELQEQMTVKNKEMENKINELEMEKIEVSRIAEEFEKEAGDAKQIIKKMEDKLKEMQKESAELEQCIRKEHEELNGIKMKNLEQSYLSKLKEIETKAKADFEEFRDEYARDFVRRSDVEEKFEELVRLQKEIAAFKSVVRSYEETIDTYVSKEKDVENKMQDHQEKIKVLRKELDNVTLQYSEAVLEKTKLINEKTILEQEVNKCRLGGNQLKRQVEEIRTDFERVHVECQTQIKHLQKCKSDLEMKISELESANAELHNKLVKLHCTTGTRNVQSVQRVPFRRQISGQTYTSEEALDECLDNAPVVVHNLQAGGDVERREANSSPDLGIESDQGRFSSLEIQNIPRPLLQTLELTESMNNLLRADGNGPLNSVTCGNEHCCQTTLEISHENSDLKRKIQKLTKLLQDTVNQLNLANQRKKQVEKKIFKEIHKTSEVLKQVKVNLNSVSDTELHES